MQLTLQDSKIWVCNQSVDFRKSIDGLCGTVIEQFEKEPKDGVFVFYNRNRDKIKILGWHRNGFVLIYKRLEHGKFHVLNRGDGFITLDKRQLSWLLAGLDWPLMSDFQELEYDEFF